MRHVPNACLACASTHSVQKKNLTRCSQIANFYTFFTIPLGNGHGLPHDCQPLPLRMHKTLCRDEQRNTEPCGKAGIFHLWTVLNIYPIHFHGCRGFVVIHMWTFLGYLYVKALWAQHPSFEITGNFIKNKTQDLASFRLKEISLLWDLSEEG